MAAPTTSVPSAMRALQITQFNAPYELRTIPVPEPGPHDLLVKVAVAGYCHTDSMVAAGVFASQLPQTASHEGSGTVVAVGDAVSSFEIGDRVMCGQSAGVFHDPPFGMSRGARVGEGVSSTPTPTTANFRNPFQFFLGKGEGKGAGLR